MAQLMMCPSCKNDIAPGEQYCRNACFVTPVPKPSADEATAPLQEPAPAAAPSVPAAQAPACGDPDCPHGGRAPAAGCRACGRAGAPTAKGTTLRFDWGTIPVPQDGPLVVGREDSPVAGRLQNHSNISRKHAEFRTTADALTVRDLDSMNGTFVNGRRLDPGQTTPLRAGDRVRFAADVEATVTGETT